MKLSDIGLDLTAHTTTPSATNIDVDMKKQKKRSTRGTLDPNSSSAALNIADSFISGPIGVMLGLQGGAGTLDLDSRPSSVPIVIIESQNVKKQLPISSSSSSASRGLLRESATASTASPSVSALHATQHTPSTPPLSPSHHSASEAFRQLRGESSNSKHVGHKQGTIEGKEEMTLSADKSNFKLQSGRTDESDIADEAVARRLYRHGWTVKNGGWVADFGSSSSHTTKLHLQDYRSRQPLHGDGELQDGVCLPVECKREGRRERSGSESGQRDEERGKRVGMRESPPDKEASLGVAFREERRGEKLCKEGGEERKDEVQELEDIEIEDALERVRKAYAEKEKQREEEREELRRKKDRRERLMVREKERARLLEVELEKDRLWEEEMLREQESESEWQREQELMRTREKERARAREWDREDMKVKASEREAILATVRKLEEEREARIDNEWQMERERRKERDEMEIRKERERQKGNDLDDETLGARVPEERFQGLHSKEDEKCKTSEMARSSIKAQVNRIVGQMKEVEMKVAVEEESGTDQQIIEKKVDERTLEDCPMEEKQITSRPTRRASATLGKIAEGDEEAIDVRIEGKEVEKEEVSNEVQWEKEIKRIREALNETERINEAEKVRERQRERERESIIGRDGAPGPRSLVLPAQVTTDSLVSPRSDGDGCDVSRAGALSQGRKDVNTSRAHCTGDEEEVEGIAEPASPFSPFNAVISSPTQLNTSLDSLRASIGISLLNPKPPHFSSSSDTSCAASLELKTLFWGGAGSRPGSEVSNRSPVPFASPPHTPSHTLLSSLLQSPAIIVRSAETEIEVTSHAVGQGLGPGAYPDVRSPTDTATVMTSTISIVTAPAISISTATSVTSQVDPAFTTPSRTQSTGSSRRNSSASVGEKMMHERRHSSQSSILGHDTVAPPGTRTPPTFNSNSRYSSGSGGVGEMSVAAYAKGESVRMMEDRNEEPHALSSDRTSEKRDDRGWELTGSGGSGRDSDVTLSPPESPLTDTSHGVGDLMYSDLGIVLSLAEGQGAFRPEGRRKKERSEEGEDGGGEVRVGRIEINTPDIIREEALGGREKGGRLDTSLEGQHDSRVFDFYPASPLYPVTPYGDSMYVTILNLTHMR